MATPVLIPVEKYLRTVYRPDCDYIDGEVQERNMGEIPHGKLHAFFNFIFRMRRNDWQVDVLSETRLQVSPSRYRIPDVMLVARPNLDERIVRTPPLLCIEILSSEDRMPRIQKSLEDYATMGVKSMWVIDPWHLQAFAAGAGAILQEAKDRLIVEGTPISISVAEIFAELDA